MSVKGKRMKDDRQKGIYRVEKYFTKEVSRYVTLVFMSFIVILVVLLYFEKKSVWMRNMMKPCQKF